MFQFFVFHGADLHIVTQADAAALVGHFADHLRHRHVGAGVLLVKAGSFGQLVGGGGDGQVAGTFVAGRLHFRAGDVVEESRNTFVFSRFFARHHPQTRTTNDGILRGTRHIGVVGQGGQTVAKFGIFGHIAVKAGRGVDHRAFARDKAGFRHIATAFVDKQALFGHVGQVLDMALVQG